MTDYSELALVRGMHYLAEQQASIAHNLANVNSTGFKRQIAVAEPLYERFSAVLDRHMPTPHFAQTTDWSEGAMLDTGEKLHVALEGDGYFMVGRPGTQQRYLTRQGSMAIDREGFLSMPSGHRYLDSSGQPIHMGNPVELNRDELLFKRDGTIVNGAGTLGQLGVFHAPNINQLRPVGNALYEERSGQRLQAAPGAQVRQGQLERSNVNSLEELVQMITVQRGFQATSKVLTSLNRIKTSFVNARIR